MTHHHTGSGTCYILNLLRKAFRVAPTNKVPTTNTKASNTLSLHCFLVGINGQHLQFSLNNSLKMVCYKLECLTHTIIIGKRCSITNKIIHTHLVTCWDFRLHIGTYIIEIEWKIIVRFSDNILLYSLTLIKVFFFAKKH